MAVASSETDRLRAWAVEQRAALLKQREGIDRRITELELFVAVLNGAPAAGSARASANGAASHEPPFGERLAKILREHGSPMTPSQVAEVLEAQGFERRAKTSTVALVGVELPRQAAKHRYGIAKVGPALYTVVATR